MAKHGEATAKMGRAAEALWTWGPMSPAPTMQPRKLRVRIHEQAATSPQIKKESFLDRSTGKTIERYRVKADVGQNPVTGKRQQAKRHCRTEAEARKVPPSCSTRQSRALTCPHRN